MSYYCALRRTLYNKKEVERISTFSTNLGDLLRNDRNLTNHECASKRIKIHFMIQLRQNRALVYNIIRAL